VSIPVHRAIKIYTYINRYASQFFLYATMSTVRTQSKSFDPRVGGESKVTKDFMTLTAAAEALGVSRFKISRLIRDGELQAFVSPLDRRQRLVRRSDVEALKQQLVPVEIDPGKIAA
jgi:excisionase family DNA binding protein